MIQKIYQEKIDIWHTDKATVLIFDAVMFSYDGLKRKLAYLKYVLNYLENGLSQLLKRGALSFKLSVLKKTHLWTPFKV